LGGRYVVDGVPSAERLVRDEIAVLEVVDQQWRHRSVTGGAGLPIICHTTAANTATNTATSTATNTATNTATVTALSVTPCAATAFNVAPCAATAERPWFESLQRAIVTGGE
jgi:hypothetical protein